MKFDKLPDQLPATVAELDELAAAITAELNVFQARSAAGHDFTADEVARAEYVVEAHEKVAEARDTVAAADQEATDKLNGVLARAAAATKKAEPAADAEDTESTDAAEDSDTEGDAAAEVVAEAEAATAEAADAAAVAASAGKPVTFAGATRGNNDIPDDQPATGGVAKGWMFVPSAPNHAEFGDQKVGALEIAQAIASGTESTRQKTGVVTRGGKDFASQAIAKLARPAKEGPEIGSAQELLDEVGRVTTEGLSRGGKRGAEALVAAGGWQAPSEQVYDFCAVPPAVNLISVPEPERPIKRGGVRYPIESDMSDLLTDFAFQFHFTETQLEAVDGQGEPTAIKHWNEIPGPTDFLEFRLGVIGYAVKVGILHQQGWPEAVAHDIERLMVRHQHGISWRTINDMVAGSGTPIVVPTDTVLGATSSILNGLALQALHLRLDKGLDVDAPVEGVAPVWLKEVIKADLALRDGLEALTVSDATINGFLTARNIYLQYVDDWQTRGNGQPGKIGATEFPGFADVLLYPAGTWFRSLNPVITFGVQYPMELLSKNQYSHGFFEDAIAVGKRCDKSIRVRVPLCVNGAVGARESIECGYAGAATLTNTITVGGTGTWKVKFANVTDPTSAVANNVTGANLKTALGALDDGHPAADFTVAGNGPYQVTYPAELGALTTDSTGLTGGTAVVS
ncbi:major capsid protein [Mycobacterium syngnathidarum]